MTVSITDVLDVLVPFDTGLAVLFGVAVAIWLSSAVIGWFSGVGGGE